MSNGKKERILKWQGGKSGLMGQISQYLPKQLFDEKEDYTFIDAFCGSAAVSEYILTNCPGVKRVLMNDLNSRLMKTYLAIKEKPSELINKLSILSKNFNSCSDKLAFYNSVRGVFNEINYVVKDWSISEIASAFIFLNKTCFNGIYRENSKKDYNVPWGKRETFSIDNSVITDFSNLLNKPGIQLQLYSGDYQIIEKFITPNNSFIYFDPPYRPLTGTNGFTAYTDSPFDDKSQQELKNFANRLKKDYGAISMVSNSYDPQDDFFGRLYKGWELSTITATRSSGGTNSTRGQVLEYLIRNYK